MRTNCVVDAVGGIQVVEDRRITQLQRILHCNWLVFVEEAVIAVEVASLQISVGTHCVSTKRRQPCWWCEWA